MVGTAVQTRAVRQASRMLGVSRAEQLEVLEKLGLPPGREQRVPLPVRTGGGGGFNGDESVHGTPYGFE